MGEKSTLRIGLKSKKNILTLATWISSEMYEMCFQKVGLKKKMDEIYFLRNELKFNDILILPFLNLVRCVRCDCREKALKK